VTALRERRASALAHGVPLWEFAGMDPTDVVPSTGGLIGIHVQARGVAGLFLIYSMACAQAAVREDDAYATTFGRLETPSLRPVCC